ncbi:hypothetical protein F4808DRAFT_464648 [Astrocystis sublimbata]|nr:hypothetical protein F4808DRAFT_464648 [Astrocystis sublimbata]
MDPFDKLPPELHLEILLATGSKHSILQLAQASPAILRSYNASSEYIYRHLLSADTDFDEGMMNDAIAVILFPTSDKAVFYGRPGWSSDFSSLLVHTHHGMWLAGWYGKNWKKAKTSGSPVDGNLQTKIDDLYHQLLFHIEDYLTKATAACPPREYLCLPNQQGHLLFQDRVITRNRFDAAKRSQAERRRLFKAFLRYDLMSKFLRWLEPEGWPRHLKHGLTNQEKRDMSCVRAYLQSLYKATIIQCGNPEYADTATKLVTSDFGDKDRYAHIDPTAEVSYGTWNIRKQSIFRSWYEKNTEVLTNCLACYGFNLATTVIKATTDGRDQRAIINAWLREVARLDGDCYDCMIEQSRNMDCLTYYIRDPAVQPLTRRQRYQAQPFLNGDRFFRLQEEATHVPEPANIFTSVQFRDIIGPVVGICHHHHGGMSFFWSEEEEKDILKALANNDPGFWERGHDRWHAQITHVS